MEGPAGCTILAIYTITKLPICTRARRVVSSRMKEFSARRVWQFGIFLTHVTLSSCTLFARRLLEYLLRLVALYPVLASLSRSCWRSSKDSRVVRHYQPWIIQDQSTSFPPLGITIEPQLTRSHNVIQLMRAGRKSEVRG